MKSLIAISFLALLVLPSFAASKKQNDNGEVTLTLRATLTGTRTIDAQANSGGSEPTLTDEKINETCIATFSGTSTWRIIDWLPSECRHDCKVTITGSGSSQQISKGWCHCNTARHPTIDTKTATWTFKPTSDATTRELERTLEAMRGNIISPAGSVVVNPAGIWFLSLSAATLSHEISPEGNATHNYKSCRKNTNDSSPIDAENSRDARAMYLIKSAYHAAFGAGPDSLQNMKQGQWEIKEKGFSTSGHFSKAGDESPKPTSDSSSSTGSSYRFKESARWKAEVDWTVTYAMEPPDVEVTIEPGADYDQWLPKGNMDEPDKPGAKHAFSIKVHKKDDPKIGKKATLSFSLEKVSKELGICLNWPDTGKAKIAEGLRFLQEDYPGQSPMKVSSRTAAATTKAVGQIDLILHSHDFGAWGSIKVTGKDEHDRPVAVTFKGRRNAPVPLPKDDNNNHIADIWEDQHAAPSSAEASDDDNMPAGKGSSSKGDGLTLYEEYRGFRVKGAHIFGDPKKKDFFVCDDTGGSAEKGINLFENISELLVHRVCKEELGTSRIINRNGSGASHIVDQHGVLIINGPDNSSPEAVAATADGVIGPPKTTKHIKLPKDSPTGTGANGARALQDFHALVAHELCHSVGVCHHGADLTPVCWAWIKDESKPDSWVLYEYDITGDSDSAENKFDGKGRIIKAVYEADGSSFKHGDKMPAGSGKDSKTQGTFLFVMGKNDVCSGNESCVIRYFDRQAYRSSKDKSLRIIPDPSRTLAPDALCDNAKGTGVNATSNKPESRCGDAAIGNCKSQILVNDRY